MNVREKLVELLKTNACPSPYMCDPACRYLCFEDCFPERFADHLISHGVTVQKWISVDDRLPEEKSNYIVYYKHAFCDDKNHAGICVCFYDGNEFEMDFLHKVTHWQYLPQPPKGE